MLQSATKGWSNDGEYPHSLKQPYSYHAVQAENLQYIAKISYR